MKIEAGKYYRDANGNKCGPIETIYGFDDWCQCKEHLECHYWDGKSVNGSDPDLIAEWQDQPTTVPDDEYNLAELAAQHGIKITVMIGDVVISYDGRK